jgi:hypothetical protein
MSGAVELTAPTLALLVCGVFLSAVLYSSVGHAGASGYLAVMALAGVAPDVMKPTALVLNVLVAMIATCQFARAGHFAWGLFWPFAVTAMPMAFWGASLTIGVTTYRWALGLVLFWAAWRMLLPGIQPREGPDGRPSLALCLPIGGAIGFVAGLTGVGGGIFLTPLLLMARWAGAKQAAAVSAAFILVNSIAGLAGHASSTSLLPQATAALAAAAAMGGWLGAALGSKRLPPVVLRRVLGLVLAVAGIKMLISS